MANENEDFMGGGVSLKFDMGTIHQGKLVSISSKVDADMQGVAKTWPNGEPKKVFLWALRGENGETATLWVRGNMVKVLREACAKAGAKKQADLIGAMVMVKHHALGEKTGGQQPAKLFQAKVTLCPPETAPVEEEYDPFKDA